MLNNVLAGILSVRAFIVFSVRICIALSFMLFTIWSNQKNNLPSFGWQALFLGLTKRKCYCLSVLILQWAFVVAGAVSNVIIGPVTIAAIAVLSAAAIISEGKFIGLVDQRVYTVMAVLALTAGNLLRDFMFETGVDLYMIAVYLLLILFIIQYATYHLVKGLERMNVLYEPRKWFKLKLNKKD